MNDIMNYKDYIASIHYSTEDEVFYGKVLGIDDLISFEGVSVRELKKAFRESVEDYFETCKQIGKEPNKTYKGSLNIRIGTDLHKDAAVCAAIYNISLNDFIRKALDFALLNKERLDKYLHRQ